MRDQQTVIAVEMLRARVDDIERRLAMVENEERQDTIHSFVRRQQKRRERWREVAWGKEEF